VSLNEGSLNAILVKDKTTSHALFPIHMTVLLNVKCTEKRVSLIFIKRHKLEHLLTSVDLDFEDGVRASSWASKVSSVSSKGKIIFEGV
jgi:ubiquinone biosynthesis protein UbiJ